MRVSSALPVLALLPSAYGQLNKLAKAKELKYFGSATDNHELDDTAYTTILSDINEFGQITVGNQQKWQYSEPTQNTFDYSGGDTIVNLAKQNGQLLRCHTLVWHQQLPSWVTSGAWTNATLIAVLKNHIKNEVTHYKGQCYAWDVVNEAFNDDGTYTSDVFYDTIGPEYIPIAFATAAQYDPDVKLYYNDYNIENPGSRSTAVQKLVASLKARGIKIDGVGLQAHFIVGSTPSLSTQLTNLATLAALGVEVAYTELDVRFPSLPPTAAGFTQQSKDYSDTVSACLQTKGCVGITLWDYTDKYSWVPGTFAGAGDACLWYSNFTKHPAYDAVVKILGGGLSLSTTTSASSSVVSTTLKTVVASTTAASSGGLAKYSQCGGNGWAGSGTCVAGTTCKYSNAYYSQCL